MTIVRNMFPGHLISRFGEVPWPLTLPIFQREIFFLWGFFIVYACSITPG